VTLQDSALKAQKYEDDNDGDIINNNNHNNNNDGNSAHLMILFTYPFLILCSLSPQSVITNLPTSAYETGAGKLAQITGAWQS
jgi:hypothetical protein